MTKEEIQKYFQISSGIKDFADENSDFHKENNPSFKEEFIETWVNMKKVELLNEIIEEMNTEAYRMQKPGYYNRDVEDYERGYFYALHNTAYKLTTTKEQLLNTTK